MAIPADFPPPVRRVELQAPLSSLESVTKALTSLFLSIPHDREPLNRIDVPSLAARYVKTGRLKPILSCLRQLGADLNKSDGEGFTPLTRAVREKDIEKIRLLKQLGASFDQCDNNGQTPLTCAVESGDLELVRFLVREMGAPINQCDKKNGTPLIHAIHLKNLGMVKCLIELGANLYKNRADGHSPLTYAVYAGNLDIVRYLVRDCRVSPNEIGGKDFPMAIALEAKNREMMTCLKELGAHLNQWYSNGRSLLGDAIKMNSTEMVEFLIKDLGANPNNPLPEPPFLPINSAISHQNKEMVKLLKKLGANLEQPTPDGYTPLTHAVAFENLQMVELLIGSLPVEGHRREQSSKTGEASEAALE